MPAAKRFKTKYPGVFYTIGKSASGKPERIYNIRYRKHGKMIEEKAGRQLQDAMTPAVAARIRANRIEGDLSNREKREAEDAKKAAEAGKWTLDKLAAEYFNGRPDGKSKVTDLNRFEKYLKAKFGNQEPSEIIPLEVDRLRIRLLKTKSPQTVKHVLNLLTWIANFGFKKNLCAGIPFHIEKPTVDNQKTENLTQEELSKLLQVLDEHDDIQIANLMKMALFTGMRRGELFKLKWKDVDLNRGFIKIVEPKGGKSQTVPLSEDAKRILEKHPRTESAFVFPNKHGEQRVSVSHSVNKIKKAAGLPKDFRPLHGLRHTFASILAGSGEVDLYKIQRLLTHKDPRMTQRYAHLRDESLKQASNVAGDIISQAAAKKDVEQVVNIEEHRK
ncbi:MAG: site-specific integrase [Desulfobacterales bacterium]|nr:site-specific integrase [Desulfobacterales bacterium]MDD4070837.1 site-specific integrase [Desulfobacterales bacterium]MDD4391239.1 site-specific integrase [Desulfobacterales bacterium]